MIKHVVHVSVVGWHDPVGGGVATAAAYFQFFGIKGRTEKQTLHKILKSLSLLL